jgi:ApaG protein
MSAASTTSLAVTEGLRVVVTSQYLPQQSAPVERRYVWAYTVRITNEGDAPVQLRSRHWVITDAKGKIEEVRGPGVVGEQPHLLPGQTFQYTSGCMLTTSRGTMQGTYQMIRDDGATFDADIALFALELPSSLN